MTKFRWWLSGALSRLAEWVEPYEPTPEPNIKLMKFAREINREFIRNNLFNPYLEGGVLSDKSRRKPKVSRPRRNNKRRVSHTKRKVKV